MSEFDWTDFAGKRSLSVDGANIAAMDGLLKSYHSRPSVDWMKVHDAAVTRDRTVPPPTPPYWSEGKPHSSLAFLGVSGRARIASDPDTPPQVLALMATDPDHGIRDRVRENSDAPLSVAVTNSPIEERRPPWRYLIGGATIAILLIAGFAGGYSFEVIDQDARAATSSEVATGSFDIFRTSAPICPGGADYLSCVNQHVAVYNSICTGRPLTDSGTRTCADLSAFVDQIKAQYGDCGAGCETIAGPDGLWGWPYLEAVAEMKTVSNNDAIPKISHTETCNFNLGPIKIGSCPGR